APNVSVPPSLACGAAAGALVGLTAAGALVAPPVAGALVALAAAGLLDGVGWGWLQAARSPATAEAARPSAAPRRRSWRRVVPPRFVRHAQPRRVAQPAVTGCDAALKSGQQLLFGSQDVLAHGVFGRPGLSRPNRLNDRLMRKQVGVAHPAGFKVHIPQPHVQ